MFVGLRMSHNVPVCAPDDGLDKAIQVMRDKKVRQLVVAEGDRVVGVLSRIDLQHVLPSTATTLAVNEMNFQLSRLKVRDYMTKKVVSVSQEALDHALAMAPDIARRCSMIPYGMTLPELAPGTAPVRTARRALPRPARALQGFRCGRAGGGAEPPPRTRAASAYRRRRQGIIDIANAYLQVTLDKGLVGIALFLGVTLVAMWSAFRAIGDARRIDDEFAVYCQSWLAALVGVMLVLATTTNVIAQIAEVHWLLCGICVGIGRSVAAMTASAAGAAAQAPAEIAAAPPPAETPKRPPVWAAPQRELPAHLRQYARKSENDA